MIDAAKAGIYKIVNKITGDYYVGSAICLRNRKSVHFGVLKKNKHNNIHLQRAFNKYGESNFEFIPLRNCKKENTLKIEQFYIDTLKPKYNICKFAGSMLGQKHSPEARRKISIAGKGKNCSPETRRKLSIANKGENCSPETRRKKSIAGKGKKRSLETRRKLSIAGKGKIPWNKGKRKSAFSPRQTALAM